MIDRFCEQALKKIRERRYIYANLVSSGTSKTIEDYRLICGKISGIDECDSLIKDLFRQVFEEKPANELARRPEDETENDETF